MAAVSLRTLQPADIDRICRHRREMFREAGREAAVLDAMAEPFRRWLEPRLLSGEYFGFLAEADGAGIGGVGLMAIDWPPHPMHPQDDRRGYVLNLYVEPDRRGRGVAKQLLAESEAELDRRGLVYAVLHTTDLGRPLYASHGWTRTSELAKAL